MEIERIIIRPFQRQGYTVRCSIGLVKLTVTYGALSNTSKAKAASISLLAFLILSILYVSFLTLFSDKPPCCEQPYGQQSYDEDVEETSDGAEEGEETPRMHFEGKAPKRHGE